MLNNPLSLTDPSGYLFKGLGKVFNKLRPLITIAIAIYASGLLAAYLGEFGALVATGFLAGVVSTGTLKGGLIGAFTAGVGAKISAIPGIDSFGNAFFQGALNGGVSAASGGNFGHSFLSAGFSSYAGGSDFVQGLKSFESQVAASAIIGGTASELSGGKFANGAATGAMQGALHHLRDETELGQGVDDIKAFNPRGGDVFDPVTRKASRFGLFPEFLGDSVNEEIFNIAVVAQRGSVRSELGVLGGVDASQNLSFTELVKGLSNKITERELKQLNSSFNANFPGGQVLYAFHTHGSDFNRPAGYENFSGPDIRTLRANKIFGSAIGFLSTPQGLLLMFNPASGETVQIGRVPLVRKPAGR